MFWAPAGSPPMRRNVKPGSTAVVVGDGAVGLLGVLSAKQMGAERIIAMSRHDKRQKLARDFGATDIVTERGDEGLPASWT
jgi:threonine dehydrogenase-like Zn-dependent dehydrogenase